MFELNLISPEECVDLVCQALEELGALSVSLEDLDAQSNQERPIFGEPNMPSAAAWQRNRLTALFSTQQGAQEAGATLQEQDFFATCTILGITELPAQDWVRLTQAQFDPVEITPEFWIVPSWHEPPAAAKVSLRLDPGLAFGTGTHPTTQMCLRWIAANSESNDGSSGSGSGSGSGNLERVLDYGCGSGILAIAAAKFGAKLVHAVDIDEDALQACKENAIANDVASDTLITGDAQLAQGLYSTVLANILATPLKVLAPLLSSHVQSSGHLVLAGILERQVSELQQAYAAAGLALEVVDSQEGWVLMCAQRS